ncbi:hypothetical protein OE88DRAFT_264936 [Heliocybe sulcata]|uniref:GmrSD restriction endonucleases N-terminal domain-containing protein n=1 Tax=Heliocybe sulcata TaxID=5364 RepID=A0A5C3MYV4_9AGAM|nr:hypothetical protein OE88DRAFT_264936 [Heliocybe sulcata]
MAENIWSEQKQCHLIDSMFRNIHVPALVFTVDVDQEGNETRTCVDGKQRLMALCNFMNGHIPYVDPTTHEKLWYKTDEEEPHRKLLAEKFQRRFAIKQLPCVEYQDICAADEIMMFERLQSGTSISYAEKLQLTTSPRATLVRELVQEYMTATNWLADNCSNWDAARGGPFKCVAQMLYHIETYPAPDRIVTSFELERWLRADQHPSPTFHAYVTETFRNLRNLGAHDMLRARLVSQKWSLAELVVVVLAVAVFGRRMHLEDVVDVVRDMRQRGVGKEGAQIGTMLQVIKNVDTRVSDVHAGLEEMAPVRAAHTTRVTSRPRRGLGGSAPRRIIPPDCLIPSAGHTVVPATLTVPPEGNALDDVHQDSHAGGTQPRQDLAPLSLVVPCAPSLSEAPSAREASPQLRWSPDTVPSTLTDLLPHAVAQEQTVCLAVQEASTRFNSSLMAMIKGTLGDTGPPRWANGDYEGQLGFVMAPPSLSDATIERTVCIELVKPGPNQELQVAVPTEYLALLKPKQKSKAIALSGQHKGTLLTVLEQSDDGRWICRSSSGESLMLPEEHLGLCLDRQVQ